MSDGKFWGKYRGTVLNNLDPEQKGRLQAQVPDVAQLLPATWALPCLPFTGIQNGFSVVPAIGSGVWIEFEHGDPSYPIWTGGWFATTAEIPALGKGPPGVQVICIQSQLQNAIVVSDIPGAGGIMLKTALGAMIRMDSTGILISNGQGATIQMNGPTVTINAGAMVIT